MLARAAVSIEPSRLDDWFLGAGCGSQSRPAPVPFFPEVHEELTSLWMAPFTARSRSSASSVLTTLDGGVARGYAGIPQVERAVAVHLCPQNATTWRNRPRLPSKACKLIAALAAKAYSAAGQAASSLHAMAILQVHQAKALKQVHEGSTDPGLMQELRRALHKLPFKMLTHRCMIKCIQPQDWFAAIDLKDAYFHVSILPRHRPFLRFAFKVQGSRFFIIRHIHNHTSIISSEMQVELKKNTAFT